MGLLPIPGSTRFLRGPFPLTLSTPHQSPTRLRPATPFPSLRRPAVVPFHVRCADRYRRLFFFVCPVGRRVVLRRGFSMFILRKASQLMDQNYVQGRRRAFHYVSRLPHRTVHYIQVLGFSTSVPRSFGRVFPHRERVLWFVRPIPLR